MSSSPYVETTPPRRALRWFGGTRFGSWLNSHTMSRIDRYVYRLTGGRHSYVGLLTGLRVVMLTTKGARTGREITVPVLAVVHGGRIGVVASNFGSRNHPAWYHNLKASPVAVLGLDGRRYPVRARAASVDERAQFWEQALRLYPGWSNYERWAGNRSIPILLLESEDRIPV